MKRKILAIVLCLLPVFSLISLAAPSVSAPCAILVEAKSGLVLYAKNEHQKAYPASTTKIMTAILALEKGNLDDMVPVSFNAVNSISFDSSKAGLFEGEVFSLRDLVYALMVCSANDAANVIAEHIAGSIPAFVEMMNQRAAELGAKNTHFVNTHGLHDGNHYTTAYDLALFGRHAMTLEPFPDIVQTRSYVLEPTEKYEEKRYLNSTNHLLNPTSPYYYADAIGVKTGYTSDAGSCLVSAAETEGVTYIAVVLGAESEDGQVMSFVDSKTLLSFGAKECPPVTLAESGEWVQPVPIQKAKGTRVVGAHAAESVVVALPQGADKAAIEKLEYIKTDLEAPIEAGAVVGKVEYRYQGLTIGETYLLADTDVERRSLISAFFGTIFSSFWTYGILVILVAVFLTRGTKKMRARQKRRRQAELRRRNKYQ